MDKTNKITYMDFCYIIIIIPCPLNTELSNRTPSMSCVMPQDKCQGHMVKSSGPIFTNALSLNFRLRRWKKNFY